MENFFDFEKRFKTPYSNGCRTNQEIERENSESLTFFYDVKAARSREMMIFMEETKIWQDKLMECSMKSGVNSIKSCKEIAEIVHERVEYYNSNFNRNTRPLKTPGLPLQFERVKK